MTSTAAVEMTANGSSGDTSGPGGTLARRYSAARGLKPGPPASPNWYQCATAGFASGQPATTGSVAASTTIIRGAARSTTRATSCVQPPVDGVGDDALPRAGAVQLEVGGIVLRQDADALSLADAQGWEASGEGVHLAPELPEGQLPVAVEDGRRVAVH